MERQPSILVCDALQPAVLRVTRSDGLSPSHRLADCLLGHHL